MFGRNKDVYIFKDEKPKKSKPIKDAPAAVKKPQVKAVSQTEEVEPIYQAPPALVEVSTPSAPKEQLHEYFYPEEQSEDDAFEDIPKKKKKEKQPKVPKPTREKGSFWSDKKKVGLLLIGVSLVVILVIAPMLNVVTASELTTCVVANGDIEKGVLISSDMLSVAEVPAASLLPIHIKEKNLAVGKYAKTDIAKDELLSTPKLTEALPFDNSYLYTLPVGKKAVSTMLPTLSSGLSSKLQSGDIISIYANLKEDSADNQAILPPELCYVKVLAVTNNQAFDLYTTPEKSELESPIADTLVLEVSDTQARVLIGLEMNAQIHAALVSRGDEALAAEYLKQQEDYFLSEETEVTITDEQSDSNMG